MSDTIAAISTPVGEGGIGIVRVSGENALKTMHAVFKECPEKVEPRHAYYGHVINNKSKQVIDEAIFIYMKSPHTYTGEDVFEVQAHGSAASLRHILKLLLESGARMAEPGEFTKRAFLNGKLDLTQAEAVIDLIKAKSDAPLSLAVNQLEGRLGTEIREIRAKLLDVLAQMAVNIDFPDEDIEQFEYQAFIADLNDIENHIEKLLLTAERGKIAREGIKIAILGRPNAGKSSLMNKMLGESRVIVTDIPGTTRDTVEETVSIGGIPVVLVDTAGLRQTSDVIESIGITKSEMAAEEADYLIFVIDASVPLCEEDIQVIKIIKGKKSLVILNKEDLGLKIDENQIKEIAPDASVVTTSLIRDDGADIIAETIEKEFKVMETISENRAIVSNVRHEKALVDSQEAIRNSITLLEQGEAIEVAELESHRAFDVLGEIIGETAGEEILDAVFSRFCLGK